MNRIDICKNIIQSIKEYITTPEKLEPHRAKNHFVRKRKLSLFQVIMYLLYTSKASMFQNLSRIREDLENLNFPDISKQALSKARQFINPALFKELYYLSDNLFYKQLPSRKLWNGYHLFAIDGSKIELKNFPVQQLLQCFKNFISTYFFQTCHLLLKIKLMKKFRLPLKVRINIDTKQTEHLLSDVSKQ